MNIKDLEDLEVKIDGFSLESNSLEVSSDFYRVTTEIYLEGNGETGVGEDVVYDEDLHYSLLDKKAELDIPRGEYRFNEFTDILKETELFPDENLEREVFRNYRRWGFEAAALDLALRQNDTDLAEIINRDYDDTRFVVSTRLGEPPSTERLEELISVYPDVEFKLDPTTEWKENLMDEVAAMDKARVFDFKGQYKGTMVDQEANPELYREIMNRFPDAVIEDPDVTDETKEMLQLERDRLSWDAIIHIESGYMNIKPSRFGGIKEVLKAIKLCNERDIKMYGGGQFELGVGREQIQILASLFYPAGPNDVAPGIYNNQELPSTPPQSPLELKDKVTGFRYRD